MCPAFIFQFTRNFPSPTHTQHEGVSVCCLESSVRGGGGKDDDDEDVDVDANEHEEGRMRLRWKVGDGDSEAGDKLG